MSETACKQCGASTRGDYVCEYCGALIHARTDIEDERKALDEFHAMLQRGDAKTKSNLLKTGFLPDHKSLLIDAGVRALPLCEFADQGDQAALRLEAIVVKLKLMPQDAETARAIDEFTKRVREHERSSRVFFGSCLLVLLGVVALVVWLIVRRH